MMSRSLAVQGEQLVFSYGNNHVLNDLDMQVQTGHIYALLGASGCGKTTLLRCILGRLQVKSGNILVYGRVPGEPNFCIPGKGVGYMPQDLALPLIISAEETLCYFGQLYLMDRKTIENRIEFLVDLLKIMDKTMPLEKLSGGQKRRVSFAVALIHEPPLLILDEPTVGLDPILRHTIWKYLNYMINNANMTIILTTHYVGEAQNCHTVGFMSNGRLLTEMNPEQLLEIHDVQTLDEIFLKLTLNDNRDPVIMSENNNKRNFFSKLFRKKKKPLYQKNNSKCSRKNKENSLLIKYSDVDNIEDFSTVRHKAIYETMSIPKQFKLSCLRTYALTRRRFIEMKRNKMLLTFRIIQTALCVAICCLAFQSCTDLRLAIVNMDVGSHVGAKFLENLDGKIITQVPYANLTLAKLSVMHGKTHGVLYIGPHLLSNLYKRIHYTDGNTQNYTILESPVKLQLDMTNRQISMVVQKVVKIAFLDFISDLVNKLKISPVNLKSLLVIEEPIYGKKDTIYRDFLLPSFTSQASFVIGMSLTAMTLVVEKCQGILDRSIVAGAKHVEIVLSIIFSMIVIVAFQVAVSIVTLFWIYNVHSQGSVLWFSINLLITTLSSLPVGLLISAICNTESGVMAGTLSLSTPFLIYSGIIWPRESMSTFLKNISYLSPLTKFAEISRNIISRGWTMFEHQTFTEFLVPVSWIVIPVALSSLILRYKN